jgi:hypothetical protein
MRTRLSKRCDEFFELRRRGCALDPRRRERSRVIKGPHRVPEGRAVAIAPHAGRGRRERRFELGRLPLGERLVAAASCRQKPNDEKPDRHCGRPHAHLSPVALK